MFDEFLDELRRRQAEAAGGRPRRSDGETAGEAEETPVDEEPANDEQPARDAEPVSIGDRRRGPRSGDPDATDAADTSDDAGAGRGTGSGPDARRGAGGPPRGPRRRRPVGGPDDGASGARRRFVFGAVLIVALVLIIGFVVGLELWTDAIWFRSVGYDAVFWTRLTVQLALFIGGFGLTVAVLLGSLWLAGRLAPPTDGDRIGGTIRSWVDRFNEAAAQAEGRQGGRGGFEPWNRRSGGRTGAVDVTPYDIPDPTPIGRVVIAVTAVFIALTVAGAIVSNWETILLWANRVPFDPAGSGTTTDPIFGRDISFFLFDLPFLRFVQATVIGLLVASLLVAGARYLVAALAGSAVLSTPVRVHLGVLAGLILMAIAFGYQLDKWELVYSDRGIATGVSYTDLNAQFLAYDVLTGLSAIAAALLVGGAFSKVMWPLGLTVAVWFIASIGIGRIYPEIIERFTVQPNEFAQEAPYIRNNIAMTRLAFDLDRWEVRDYRGEQPLTQEQLDEHSATFLNARLWDYRPLGDTLDQLQTVRQYYDFTDVDTDRYLIGDSVRQVMLSVRELARELNPRAVGWVNERVIYTHGIGVAMVPVNEVATQGQPRLLIRDLPPVSAAGVPTVTQPRVYFGERDSSYVVVGARQREFDYPRGQSDEDQAVETRWTGTTGIGLDTTLSRLLFALRFRDLNLLISDQVTNDSQLLFHRSLSDRLPRIAPFLRFDKDPYIVITDAGRLVYIQDAYTMTDRFPHAQRFDPQQLGPTGLGSDLFNYLRNSVKITVDAYDGTMTFYVNDPDDPLIRAWQGVFPTLFRPMTEFPADLRSHLRVPEELFNVQTRAYGRYHVQNDLTFYQQDDLWTVPVGQSTQQSLPSEAYYVIMSLPEAVNPEFLLLQPMIPTDRPNMIAWVAARNDGEDYGQTLVYRFPTETTIFGPAQIEAQIDSDPEISAQFTLWKNSGSEVIRGNLIVVPVGESLVYLQPIYLRSTSAKFPAFQRIIVASPTTVVWGTTLRDALGQLLEDQPGGPGPSPTPTPTPGPTATPGPTTTPGPGPTPPADDVAALVEYANLHFELAQEALRDGDFARYGEEIALVQQALGQLEELVGAASPAPSAAP
ncbi:MAG TPA: UPF0182 family protein [Candidatus Limnocylindrales bacterium]|nr:UPF0182 family protein [Candidatus Limnocylindrales bacterium]